MARNQHNDLLDHESLRVAVDVPYDNSGSGLSATDVQGAIDEVATGGGGGGITPHVVYAECNNSFGLTVQTVAWDTFYDPDYNVISGGTLTAALAAMGLTYSAGVFTATMDCIIAFHINIGPVSAPALQGSQVVASSEMYTGGTKVSWGVVYPATGPTNALPPQHATWLNEINWFKSGDPWELDCNTFGTASAEVIDYADMAIMRLV